MSRTLNMTDEEARMVAHLARNELQGMGSGSVPEDEDYRQVLERIVEKAEGES